MMPFKSREQRGAELVRTGSVSRVSQSKFVAKSQNSKTRYEVTWNRNRWICQCKDFGKHGKKCKHIYAVNFFLQMSGILSEANATSKQSEYRCPRCGSLRIIKRGFTYSRQGPVQRYLCKKCMKRFTMVGIERSKTQVAVIMASLDLFFRGLSLSQTSSHLETYWRTKVSPTTILRWVRKFVDIISKATDKGTSLRSRKWAADETIVTLSGRHMLIWSLLDDETRFYVAHLISKRRTTARAVALFGKGLKRSTRPREIVTDGAPVYGQAIARTFRRGAPLIHVKGPGLATQAGNNKLERFQGRLKKRVKAMGGFRSKKSMRAFADGFAIFHNYIEPHKALKGRTPAQASGLASDKLSWDDLFRRARRNNRRSSS